MLRNQTCPCGSGKKHKKCCLKNVLFNPMAYHTPLKPGGRVYLSSSNSTSQPNDYVSLLDLGIHYKRTGSYAKAKEQYIKAIKVNPKHFQAYYNLGKVLYILGEYQQAVRSYKTALELGHSGIGDVMRHLGHGLLDEHALETDMDIIKHYRQSLDPFKRLIYKKPSTRKVDDYDAKCAAAAREYLETLHSNE